MAIHTLKSPAPSNSATSASSNGQSVQSIVADVIADIRSKGDVAVRSYSEKFDNWSPASFKLSVSTYSATSNLTAEFSWQAEEIQTIIAEVPEQTVKDIKEVQSNVRAFALAQRECIKDLEIEIRPGVKLGHKNIPIETVGW